MIGLTLSQALKRAKRANEAGKASEARTIYNAIIKTFPNHVGAQKALDALGPEHDEGDIHPSPEDSKKLLELCNRGQFTEAIQEAQALKENFPRSFFLWNMIAGCKASLGKLDEAIAGLKKALELNPNYVEGHNNLGLIFERRGKLDDAIASYKRALEVKPDYPEAISNLSNALKNLNRLDDAVASHERALKLEPNSPRGHNNLGIALKGQGKLDKAVASYKRALELKPDYLAAEIQMLHQQQHLCDFSVYSKLDDTMRRLDISAESPLPFMQLSWEDNAANQLKRSQKYTTTTHLAQPKLLFPRPIQLPQRIKVGYFSADFHDHATLHLLAGVLRHHERSNFEIHSYSYGLNKSGEWRQRALTDVEHFHDVANYSDDQIVELARSHQIDIAIDLKGYTTDTRSALFQYRLAPIQINYLGYPGSMGTDFIDYMIGDPLAIPDEQRQFYSEKIIYLPDCYQPTDNKRLIPQVYTKREDFGLPKNGFVFCCFNNNYKISPREFDIWMRLLTKVEGSVLWLFESNKSAKENLRKEAQKRGVEKNRLVFAKKLPQAEHLARHRHADLFVDTFNYNAHTTASDALWVGLPVLTKAGEQFAARVAASILRAIDLPNLVTTTEADYEQLALELSTEPKKLDAVRKELKRNIKSKPLFDTGRYTRNLEKGLQMAFDDYFEGNDPKDIWVSGM